MNIDCSIAAEPDRVYPDFNGVAGAYFYNYDLSQGLPGADNSLDVIYHCHFLEHLSYVNAIKLLRQARFRLKPGGIMRLLVKHGADPLFVHHSERVVEGRGEAFVHRKDATTALMAATGMGGGRAWAQPAPGEREAVTLETVKLAVELGVDVNAAGTDGRTALDAARTLKYDTVVKFLLQRGAKPGTGAAAPPTRDKDSGPSATTPR